MKKPYLQYKKKNNKNKCTSTIKIFECINAEIAVYILNFP